MGSSSMNISWFIQWSKESDFQRKLFVENLQFCFIEEITISPCFKNPILKQYWILIVKRVIYSVLCYKFLWFSLIEEQTEKKLSKLKLPPKIVYPNLLWYSACQCQARKNFRGQGHRQRFPTTTLYLAEFFSALVIHFFPKTKNVCYIVRSHRISLFCSQHPV